MKRSLLPPLHLALPLVAALVLGCPDDSKPRLYATYDVPPAGLVTAVPPSLLDQVDEGQEKVEVSEQDIANLVFLGPSLLSDKAGSFRGVNFSVYSRRAEKVRLLLFDDPEAPRATREFDMKRLGDVWNLFVEGVGIGQHYGYIAWGPNWQFEERWYPGSVHGFFADVDVAGNRFNPNKLLMDPYCKAVHRDHDWGKGSLGTGPHRIQSTFAAAAKCTVVESVYQWSEPENEWRRRRAEQGQDWSQVVLYEVHPKGFTANSASGVEHPGTFRGFGEKADYLKDLGITAVELLPPGEKPADGGYWGYNTLNFFAPEISFSSRREREEVIDEFKWMVEQLHERGIEVILDVVYNHTGEGGLWREMIFNHRDDKDPTPLDPEETASLFSYRGLDNDAYYALVPSNRRQYRNESGVGNTTRCNNLPMKRLIIDSLRWWVEEMHVDGFRFDLAPLLGMKDEGNEWVPTASVLQEIVDDPVLRRHNTRIIAEPWAAGGMKSHLPWDSGFMLGFFPSSTKETGHGWGEWNAFFRDWWRSFVNEDVPAGFVAGDWLQPGKTNWEAERIGVDGGKVLTGSTELFAWNGRRPYHSINFITCHDGMTLYDLVTFPAKRNGCSPLNPICCDKPNSPWCVAAEKSGEDNNRSRDWGSEEMKRQQMRNFFVAMMVSHGTPMILGGDEWMRTQLGNNNAYTDWSDNAYNWYDWGAYEAKDERHRMVDFVRRLIQFRKAHAYAFAPAEYGKGAPFAWKTPENNDMGGGDWGGRRLMVHYHDRTSGPELAILVNMDDGQHPFTLPAGKNWRRVLDTQSYFDRPEFLAEKGLAPRSSANISTDAPEALTEDSYGVAGRSIVVLEAP